MNKTMEGLLRVLDLEWAAVATPEGFSPIPDGTYPATVDSAELSQTKEKRLPMVTFKLHLTDLDRFVWKNHVIRSAESLPFLKSDLAVFGIVPVKLSQLAEERTLQACYGAGCKVTLKTKDGQQRVYISR